MAIAVRKLRRPGVAEEAGVIDLPVKVNDRHRRVTGRQIPSVSLEVRERRFEYIVADPDHVGSAHEVSADLESHGILRRESPFGQSMHHLAVTLLAGQNALGEFVGDARGRQWTRRHD